RGNVSAVTPIALRYFQQLALDEALLPASAELQAAKTISASKVWNTSILLNYHGIPVRGAVAHVTLGKIRGNVMMVRNQLPSAEPNISEPIVTDARAQWIAESHEEGFVASKPKLIYVEHDGELLLAYETLV